MMIPPTIADLISGRRSRLNEKEFAYLSGVSRFTLQKRRYLGQPPNYERDPLSGRIFYSAKSVLEYLNLPKHASTSEYDGGVRVENVRRARALAKGGRNDR